MSIGHLYGFAKEKTVFILPDPQKLFRITNYFYCHHYDTESVFCIGHILISPDVQTSLNGFGTPFYACN